MLLFIFVLYIGVGLKTFAYCLNSCLNSYLKCFHGAERSTLNVAMKWRKTKITPSPPMQESLSHFHFVSSMIFALCFCMRSNSHFLSLSFIPSLFHLSHMFLSWSLSSSLKRKEKKKHCLCLCLCFDRSRFL